MTNQTRGLQRIYNAAGYSIKGLYAAWQHEAAFRQEVMVCLPALLVVCGLNLLSVERILLLGVLLLVLIVELLNSALEAAIDRIGLEHHPLSGRAKDMASAAVFLAVLLAVVTWGVVLWPHIKTYFM
jgi:diacylglycerol kinase (ATP)